MKNWGKEKNLPSRPNDLLDHARTLILSDDTANRTLPKSGLVFHARATYNLRRVQASRSMEQQTKAFLMAGELREKIPMLVFGSPPRITTEPVFGALRTVRMPLDAGAGVF